MSRFYAALLRKPRPKQNSGNGTGIRVDVCVSIYDKVQSEPMQMKTSISSIRLVFPWECTRAAFSAAISLRMGMHGL